VDKLIVQISEESQPRWLNFERGRFDYIDIPKDNFDSVVPDSKTLSPNMQKRGIELQIVPSLDITYNAFNHDLKLFKNVKLRQAMSLAYNIHRANKTFFNDRAIPAQSIVPPGLKGHLGDFKNPYRGEGKKENLELAKKLLAEAGYPGGQGLPVIDYDVTATTVARQMAEFFKSQMAQIGINIKVNQSPWPEFQEKVVTRKVMMFGMAWGADYPDAENFLQLFYGPNKSPGANGSGYDSSEFNKLFLEASLMQDGPLRTKLYEKLNLMVAKEVPVIFGVHRQSYILVQKWLGNFIYSDFEQGNAKYFNVDLDSKEEILSE